MKALGHRFFALFAFLAFLSGGPVFAAADGGCMAGAADTNFRACLGQDLRKSDKRINAVYRSLMGAMDKAEKKNLRKAQRAWLKKRDKACRLSNKESDREKWLQAILADQVKTMCVVRFTFGRVAKLETLLKAKAGTAAQADLPAAPSAVDPLAIKSQKAVSIPAGLRALDDGYKLCSRRGRRAGHWYYEVRIDIGAIAEHGDMLLYAGYLAQPGGGHIGTVSIRKAYKGRSPITLGLAVDLKQGFVYLRKNGRWLARPGSTEGGQVRLNRDWSACVNASSNLMQLVKAGVVRINLGEKPFAYSLPDGYRPFAEK